MKTIVKQNKESDDSLFIAGASGSNGTFAIQLA